MTDIKFHTSNTNNNNRMDEDTVEMAQSTAQSTVKSAPSAMHGVPALNCNSTCNITNCACDNTHDCTRNEEYINTTDNESSVSDDSEPRNNNIKVRMESSNDTKGDANINNKYSNSGDAYIKHTSKNELNNGPNTQVTANALEIDTNASKMLDYQRNRMTVINENNKQCNKSNDQHTFEKESKVPPSKILSKFVNDCEKDCIDENNVFKNNNIGTALTSTNHTNRYFDMPYLQSKSSLLNGKESKCDETNGIECIDVSKVALNEGICVNGMNQEKEERRMCKKVGRKEMKENKNGKETINLTCTKTANVLHKDKMQEWDEIIIIRQASKRIRMSSNNNNNNNNSNESMTDSKSVKEEKGKEQITFEIREILMNIIKFLQINEIIRQRRINKYFNKQLYFDVKCRNFDVYFEYNNAIIKKLIENRIGNLRDICIWFIQTMNRCHSQMIFKAKMTNKKDQCPKPLFLFEMEMDTSLIKSDLNKLDLICNELNLEKNENSDNKFKGSSLKNGNVCFTVFETIWYQIKCIDEAIETKEYKFDMFDYLMLAGIYKIFPITKRFQLLLKHNETFRNELIKSNYSRHFANSLRFLWRDFGIMKSCFACGNSPPNSTEVQPKDHLFANQACAGDFSMYETFLSTIKTHSEQSRLDKSGSLFCGLIGMIAMFLRLDLLHSLTHDIDHVDSALEALFFLIKPNLLMKHKNNLIKAMIPIKNENEFDLFENPRFNVMNRLKFMWYLCFSTRFAEPFFQRHIHYGRGRIMFEVFRQYMNKLYYNFDYFAKKWYLNKYKELNGNESKQKHIHSIFHFTRIFWIVDMVLGAEAVETKAKLHIQNSHNCAMDL